MLPSSRTPEGDPGHCEVCGSRFRIEPSLTGDAPCPCCGSLAWFLRRSESRHSAQTSKYAFAIARKSAARRPKAAANAKHAAGGPTNRCAQFVGLAMMLAGSMSLAGAAVATTAFHSPALGNALGGTGLASLAGSSLPLLHAYDRWGQLKRALVQTFRMEVRLPRRLTVWERAGAVVPAENGGAKWALRVEASSVVLISAARPNGTGCSDRADESLVIRNDFRQSISDLANVLCFP
jgi:hypothetical protein